MTKEEFIEKIEEFIEEIKDRKVNVPDEMFFLEYNKIVYDVLNDKENLIKYLETSIDKEKYEINVKGNYQYRVWVNAYKDLLERIKNGKYE